jgi:hypothetical protein
MGHQDINVTELLDVCQKSEANALAAVSADKMKEIVDTAEAVHKAFGLLNPGNGHQGCVIESWAMFTILSRKGFDVIPVAGEAAWRLGPGDGDSVGCLNSDNTSKDFLYGHAWVSINIENRIIFVDGTVASMNEKVAQSEKEAENPIQVEWDRKVLVFDAFEVDPEAAISSPHAGAFAYQTSKLIMGKILRSLGSVLDSVIQTVDLSHRILSGAKVTSLGKTDDGILIMVEASDGA